MVHDKKYVSFMKKKMDQDKIIVNSLNNLH